MPETTTMADRRKELQALLREIADHPEHDMTQQRERARVLSQMLEIEEAERG